MTCRMPGRFRSASNAASPRLRPSASLAELRAAVGHSRGRAAAHGCGGVQRGRRVGRGCRSWTPWPGRQAARGAVPVPDEPPPVGQLPKVRMLHHLGRPHSRLVRLPPGLFLHPLAIPCASPSAPRISCMSCAGRGCPCYSYPSMRAALHPPRPRPAPRAQAGGRTVLPPPRPAMPPDCLPWAREQDLGRERVGYPGQSLHPPRLGAHGLGNLPVVSRFRPCADPGSDPPWTGIAATLRGRSGAVVRLGDSVAAAGAAC